MRTMEETARSRAAGLSLEDALERFVIQLQADGRSVHTIGQYRRNLLLLERWLVAQGRSDKVEEVDHEVLARFLVSPEARVRADGAEKKATSTNGLRTSLRVFFGYVHATGWTRLNAARLVRRAKCGTPQPRALGKDYQQRLVDALASGEGPAAERDHALFRLLLETGLRIGEALALDVCDLELDRGEMLLRNTKGNRPDAAFVGRGTCEHLRHWLGNRVDGPVFLGRGGRRLGARQAARRLQTWCREVGIRSGASPHVLRHCFAQRLLDQTRDISLVQKALRHRSITSTLVYARCSEDRLRAAVTGVAVG